MSELTDKQKIILVGFGGHARSVADSIELKGEYEVVGYTDLQKTEADNGYPYLGTDDRLQEIFDSGVRCAVVTVGQIGDFAGREKLYDLLKKIGYSLPAIIDPTAVVSSKTQIGEGTYIGKGAILNSNVSIGKMCIINSAALCEHDCRIGDFTHVAVRAVLCGEVKIGVGCFIGANSTIVQSVEVGDYSFVDATALVSNNVAGKGRVRHGK